MPAPYRNLTDQRFGRLTVVEQRGRDSYKKPLWLCQCDCGNTRIIRSHSLTSGHTTSCGCVRIDAITTHSKTRTPEYTAWHSMKSRCYRETDISYPRYGALGIKVCDRWLNSFENFLADMGEKPDPKYSLDRIDSAGNYEPANCRWSDIKTQDNNRRSNRRISMNGKTQTVTQWARELGISASTIFGRLARGKTVEAALTK